MRFLDYLSLSLRSLRRSRMRSLLTIFAIVIGATGITVMLTFVTTVKNLTVASFVKTGQIEQIQIAQATDLRYDPTGMSVQSGGGSLSGDGSTSSTTQLTAALETKISKVPHVVSVAAVLRSRSPAISNIRFKGKDWVVQSVLGYEPTGALTPAVIAGRDLKAEDSGNQLLISKNYADVLGFSGKYESAIGVHITLHTMEGYTGAGANLPTRLPPMHQCAQNQRKCFGGPTSGLPAIDIPATIVGVLDNSENGDQPLIMMPLGAYIDIYNQSQPANVQFAPQNNQQGSGNNGGHNGGNNGGNNGNQQPSGPGVVVGGWSRPSVTTFIANQGGFDSFMAKADDVTHVAEVASAIARFGVGTSTGLKALNDQKAQANIIGLVLGGLGLIALLIASLGVMNTMIMSVLQRTREIGVMRALGARRKTIRRIFTIEATAIGFFGGVIGVIFGSIFVLVAKPIITNMAKSGSLTGATFTVPPWLMLAVIAGTSGIGFLSGFFPARRASNLDPVEALRYE